MAYSDKLKDPRWQKKRLKIMERDGFKCTLCQDEHTTLNVHHEKYKGDPWDIEDEYLRTVCEECHQVLHECKDYGVLKVLKRYSEQFGCMHIFA